MNKVIAALKRIRLGQILMAFLAGVLLLVSTACGNGGGNTGVQAGSRQEVPAGKLAEPGKTNPRPEVPGGTATSPSSDVINRFEGGSMNEFSDVDPRAKEAATAAADKAAALKDNAQRNIDQPGNAGDKVKRSVGEDVGKNLRQSAEDVKNRAQGATEDVVQGTKQAAENAKDSTLNTTRDLTKSANRAAEDATENTKAAGTNLVDRAQQAVQNTNEFVQDKLNQAARGTQNTLNKTGNAINDAVD